MYSFGQVRSGILTSGRKGCGEGTVRGSPLLELRAVRRFSDAGINSLWPESSTGMRSPLRSCGGAHQSVPKLIPDFKETSMSRPMIAFVLVCIGVAALSGVARADTANSTSPSVAQTNPVVDWNKTLLTIVRTPGAQPPTVHGTRNFAILHAAIYDAVNSIDRKHEPYAVELTRASRTASEDAAAASAAHAVLKSLYPN